MHEETWEEKFARSWNDSEREGYFDKRTTKREIAGFICREIEQAKVEFIERVLLDVGNATFDVVAPPEDAKRFMGDWERGIVTGGWSVKERVIAAIKDQYDEDHGY